MIEREKQIAFIQKEIEFDFELIGATAIEDKLQEDVDITIELLKKAGIKIWMLTGDKIETAINIGHSTNLLNKSSELLIIDGEDNENIIQIINEEYTKIFHLNRKSSDRSLILSGNALKYLQESNKEELGKLMLIAKQCKTVLACRVSPKQKRDIVDIFKKMVIKIKKI